MELSSLGWRWFTFVVHLKLPPTAALFNFVMNLRILVQVLG